jgi:hypothetical protein
MAHALYAAYYKPTVETTDKLFLDRTKYDGVMDTLNSIAAYYVKNVQSGFDSSVRALGHPQLTARNVMTVVSNLHFYESRIKEMQPS